MIFTVSFFKEWCKHHFEHTYLASNFFEKRFQSKGSGLPIANGRAVLNGKKKSSGTSFPKKARGHSMCSTMVGGGWRLAVGGGWRLAVGNWRSVAVGGGWRQLVVGDWWLVAVGSGWQLAVGCRWRLAAVGGWRLVAVGGSWRLMGVGSWRLVVPWGGP